MTSNRKIVQIACGDAGWNKLVALCDDGTVWNWEPPNWRQLKPVPQYNELNEQLPEMAKEAQ